MLLLWLGIMKMVWCPVFLIVVLLFNDALIHFILCATASQNLQQWACGRGTEPERMFPGTWGGLYPGNSLDLLPSEWLAAQAASSATRDFLRGNFKFCVKCRNPTRALMIGLSHFQLFPWLGLCFEEAVISVFSKKLAAGFWERLRQVVGERRGLPLPLWSDWLGGSGFFL